MLYRLEPNKQKYTKEKIDKFITQKFIPNENYEEAKLKFNMKVENSHKCLYSSSFIDFFHQSNESSSGIFNFLFKGSSSSSL